MSENGPAAMVAPASRAAGVVVTVLAGFVGLAGLALVLGLRIANAGQELAGQSLWIVAWLAVGIVDVVAGAALVTRFGNRRLAFCLVVVGAAAVLVAVAIQSQSYAASIAGTTSSWDLLAGADAWARPLAMGVLAALVPLELASRRRRHSQILWWSALAVVAATAVGAAAGAHVPGVDIVDVTTWLVAAAAATASGLLVVGWWRSRGVDDDPLHGWLAAGSVVAWLVVVPSLEIAGREIPAHDVVVPLLLLSTLPLLIVGLLVRVLRERPGRFHGVAHEVIVWLALAAAIAVVYTGVVAGIGRLVGDSGSTWLLVATTVVIAVCIEPARHRVRIAVDRLVWGVRDDPLAVVRSIVDHLGADPGDELLPSLAESLEGDLHFDSVAIDVLTPQGWRREAGSSASTTYQRVVELEHDGEVVGRLVVGWEYGPSLRARDERMLAELAGALALALGWVRLANDLRRSNVAVVTTREEERRRLRRDLHDGLGPSLTGVSLGVRTALRQLERTTDTEASAPARQLLARAADEVDAIVTEVKRIARDLRPTALDQLGLVDAVAEFTRTFGAGLEFELTLPEEPVELPAAVEVATYRIVTEAVTNVVRHARATRCWLSISTGSTGSTGSTVEIDVVDDGIGVTDAVPLGVGWTAMRERATELGGTIQIASQEPAGTRVHVRLPVVSM